MGAEKNGPAAVSEAAMPVRLLSTVEQTADFCREALPHCKTLRAVRPSSSWIYGPSERKLSLGRLHQ
jgi:hypothetical protein